MDICTAFVPNFKPPEAVQPRVRALDNPTMTAEFLLRLHTFTGDPRGNATPTQGSLVLLRLVSLVRVQLVGSLAGTSSGTFDRLDGIQSRLEHRRLVDIGRCQQDREGDPLALDHKMAFRALFAAVRWIPSGFFAPPGEATVEASIEARLPSMRSALAYRSHQSWWSRSQTPACCQSRRRRQQVMPLPQPISLGSISQGMPLRRTKRMPARAARSGTRGRPPFGFGLSGGNKGAISSQSLSLRSGRILRPRITRILFC